MTQPPPRPWRVGTRKTRNRIGATGKSQDVEQVVIHLGNGVTAAMSANNAFRLADKLVDAAEYIERNRSALPLT